MLWLGVVPREDLLIVLVERICLKHRDIPDVHFIFDEYFSYSRDVYVLTRSNCNFVWINWMLVTVKVLKFKAELKAKIDYEYFLVYFKSSGHKNPRSKFFFHSIQANFSASKMSNLGHKYCGSK